MGLLLAALSIAVIALAVLLYRQDELFKKLRNSHLNLATEVGVVRRENAEVNSACLGGIEGLRYSNQQAHAYTKSVEEELAATNAYAMGLNERLVLLEIEKTAAPKPAEEPPPARRSFASQKARAEAGARKA
jgi:hypothetical protein